MVLGNEYIDAVIKNRSDKDKVNSASLDLALGNQVTLVNFGGYQPKSILKNANGPDPYQQMLVDASEYEPIIRYTEVDLKDFPSGIWVRPGVGILCHTATELHIPKDAVGQIILKSSRGREFYQLANAGYFDNGFKGQGTLQLHAPVIPIFLQEGLRIVQMRFDELTESSFDYSTQEDAKYQNSKGVMPSADAKY